jgi:hypothetical protein
VAALPSAPRWGSRSRTPPFPRAAPWASTNRPIAPARHSSSPNGALCKSPGHRPGGRGHPSQISPNGARWLPGRSEGNRGRSAQRAPLGLEVEDASFSTFRPVGPHGPPFPSRGRKGRGWKREAEVRRALRRVNNHMAISFGRTVRHTMKRTRTFSAQTESAGACPGR